MQVQRMILNECSYFGPGARKVLGEEIEKRKFRKILVVTDKSLLEHHVTAKVLEELDNHLIGYEVFSDIKPNPTVASVLDGLKKCKDSLSDCILAVGGGSVIDTAKAIGIIMTNDDHRDVVSLDGSVNTESRALPIIAMPTTAGTAAEVTINYVITDEERKKKMVCVDPHDIPILSIVDTELMSEMPENIAAWTGMDALTHAMEGFITKNAWEMSDMFHLQAMTMINRHIVNAVLNHDMESINQMGVAQYIAGMGFSNVGLGIVHSMAHQLGAVYDTPHGLANAILLPYVMAYNGTVCVEKFNRMGEAFGLDMNALTKEEIIQKVVDHIFTLNEQLHIPKRLIEIGVVEEDLKMLAEKAMQDVCTAGNPKEVSASDLLEIYQKAYK